MDMNSLAMAAAWFGLHPNRADVIDLGST